MNFEVLGLDVAPQLRSPSREVPGGRQNAIRRDPALLGHVNLRHEAMPTVVVERGRSALHGRY